MTTFEPLQDGNYSTPGSTSDLICGGFPCQDISVAGKGEGLDGARSGLWFEYARLIGEVRPVFVIIENVPRLRTLGADRVLADLEGLGYTGEAIVVGAVHAGAPHKRQRAWIVAHTNGGVLRKQPGRRSRARRTEAPLFAQYGAQWPMADATKQSQREPTKTTVAVAAERRARHEFGDGGELVADANSQPMERPAIARAQCRPWDTEPDVGRVVDGLPAVLVEDELRALGNAVVPQIPELIGRAIMTIHALTPCHQQQAGE